MGCRQPVFAIVGLKTSRMVSVRQGAKQCGSGTERPENGLFSYMPRYSIVVGGANAKRPFDRQPNVNRRRTCMSNRQARLPFMGCRFELEV